MYQLSLLQTPISVFLVPLGNIKFKSAVPVTSICGGAGKKVNMACCIFYILMCCKSNGSAELPVQSNFKKGLLEIIVAKTTQLF